MTPGLKEQLENACKAVAIFQRYLKDVQTACPHKQVLHSNYQSSEFFSAFKGHRICLDCGLEEMCSNLSDDDYGYKELKTGGFHKVVCQEEIYKHRIRFDDRKLL